MAHRTTESAITRREALAGATAVAGAAALGAPAQGWAARVRPGGARRVAPGPRWRHGGGLAQRGLDIAAAKGRGKEGRFGLMFKGLEPFAPPDEALSALARQMADTSSAPGPSPADNPAIPAGFTFLGQFVDHDMTLDLTPLSAQEADPHATTNFDTPHLDLGSLYGRGPKGSPELYDAARPGRLRLARPNGIDDLPRGADGRAHLGDPRNDENLILSQLHVAFLRFHNRLVDEGRSFADAQRLTRWHFQWVVVHDLLAHVVGPEVVARFLRERGGRVQCRREHYKPKNPHRPMMPIEYSAAAYRFGHSMVRPGYLLSMQPSGPVLAPTFLNPPDEVDLHGGRPVPAHMRIDWREFFELPGASVPPHNVARRIDPELSLPLHDLPSSVVPRDVQPVISNLAERNLLRGKRLGLPSGQAVARAMGVVPLTDAELGLSGPPFAGAAPLWYYVLAEARHQHQGLRLGEVGGRIVAETILGILGSDRSSYFHVRGFRPLAPAGERFRMGDLLAFAAGG
jgi:hypothetical protein